MSRCQKPAGQARKRAGPRPPVPAPAFASGRGLVWLSEAIALLRLQPFRLLILGLVLQLLGGFSQAGVLGVVFVILAPALAAGMLQGLQLAAAGQRPPVMVLFIAFTQPARLPGLMLLGLLTVLLAVLTVAVVLGGSLGAWTRDLIARLEAGDPAAVSDIDPQILLRVVMGLVFGVLLGGSLGFFAVPLMWFHAMPLGRALWTGVWVMLRQWRALLVLGLMVALLGLPVGSAVGMAVSAQAMSGNPSMLLTCSC